MFFFLSFCFTQLHIYFKKLKLSVLYFLYKIDNVNKPIKIISSYKLQELIDICNKLAIEIINKDTNKKKTKNELYEAIIQYF